MHTDLPLINAIDTFLDRHQMSPTTFGRLALNDPQFVRDLRKPKPRRLFSETEHRVRDFMARHEEASSADQVPA